LCREAAERENPLAGEERIALKGCRSKRSSPRFAKRNPHATLGGCSEGVREENLGTGKKDAAVS